VTLNEPPVRNCCFQRHWGVVCPDGKVMCCLCFERFELSELHVDDDGSREDVCLRCYEYEQQEMARRGKP
jgi:hypothetical protein